MKSTGGIVMIIAGIAGLILLWMYRPVELRSMENILSIAMENPNAFVLKPIPFYAGVAIMVALLIAGIRKVMAASKTG